MKIVEIKMYDNSSSESLLYTVRDGLKYALNVDEPDLWSSRERVQELIDKGLLTMNIPSCTSDDRLSVMEIDGRFGLYDVNLNLYYHNGGVCEFDSFEELDEFLYYHGDIAKKAEEYRVGEDWDHSCQY